MAALHVMGNFPFTHMHAVYLWPNVAGAGADADVYYYFVYLLMDPEL